MECYIKVPKMTDLFTEISSREKSKQLLSSMDEIFASIFNYVNKLVNLMRPRKRLIIAIDGVAPRAKMNNQRQRRYHAARSNKSLNEFLTNELNTNPGVISFKNNSISPGTEFMFDLIDKIKFFIVRKLHEDDNWKNLEIVFSGGDVPGEGEHKIMDWIRGWKQSPDYDINESHCVYSNDADLIFLSLSLHLPKMMILREVMEWNDSDVNSATNRETQEVQMELLYINLIREYMNLEFRRDFTKYTHTFDIERIIDDFILIAFFIGNDFLHQLYCMNTKRGNFDEIIEVFKKVLPTLGGYFSDKGEINWRNFLVFLKEIQFIEVKMIETTYEEMRMSLKKTVRNQSILFYKTDELEFGEDYSAHQHGRKDSNSDFDGEAHDSGKEDDMNRALEEEAKSFSNSDSSPEDKYTKLDQDRGLRKMNRKYEIEMQLYFKKIRTESEFISKLLTSFKSGNLERINESKVEFYSRYFGISNLDSLDDIVMNYIKGIQFVMYYYFHGIPSWTWYYPFFISPFLSDFTRVMEKYLDQITVNFPKDHPYNPYDQLAYILPRQSLGLLPNAYAEHLINDPRSAMYYPENLNEFEPFDGIHDYQWIAKLEQFDDKLMKDVLTSVDTSKMSQVEIGRNSPGTELIYKYDPKAAPLKVKSLIKGLPDFEDTISVTPFSTEKQYPFDPKKMSYSQAGEELNDGFPSLHSVPGIEGYLATISSKGPPYSRLVLKIYGTSRPHPTIPYQKHVFYDFPFKKIGFINSVVTKTEVVTTGTLPPEVVNAIADKKKAKAPEDVHKTVLKTSLGDLYYQKGVDYDCDSFPEVFYSLESRKSAWRTATDAQGSIVYEFSQVADVYPEGMLFPFVPEELKTMDVVTKFPTKENEIFLPGLNIVSLFNGDLLKISDPQPKADIANIYADLIKPNNNLSREVTTAQDLLENDWMAVDEKFLADLGLYPQEIWMLYGVLDSMVIRTDSSKTSCLILGANFDIGLRYFKVQSTTERNMLIVIDLIR
jgi:hypothetical protein